MEVTAFRNSGTASRRKTGIIASLSLFFFAFLFLLGIEDSLAEEVEALSTTMTVGKLIQVVYPSQLFYYGYHDYENKGSISDTTFSYEGVTYTIERVWAENTQNKLYFETEPAFPPENTDINYDYDFVLQLGSRKFNFNNVESSTNSGLHRWSTGYSLGWDEDDNVNVKITASSSLVDGALRFAARPEPTSTQGRLEIFDDTQGDDGQWKWICDDDFGEDEAKVACGQLSLPTGGAEVWEPPDDWLQIKSTGFLSLLEVIVVAIIMSVPGLLDDVDCEGTESKLIDCSHAGRGVTNCEISESVGVTCEEASDDDDSE